jgi:predicted nucleotidyltransferase
MESDNEILRSLRDYFHGRKDIRLVYLFGSYGREEAHEHSDIDVGVYPRESIGFAQLDGMQSDLRERLRSEVDVVSMSDAPPALAYRIIAEGQLVYAASEYDRIEIEANIYSRYGDYLPVLKQQRQRVLEGANYDRNIQRYRTALDETERVLGQIDATDGEAKE